MLEQLLGSRTRAGVLRCLIGSGRRLGLLELQRAVGTSVSSVQKDVARLESIGLIRSTREDGKRMLSAVTDHPYHEPIRALLAADGSRPAWSDIAAAVNPAVAPFIADITESCRRHGVAAAALVGSATQTEASVVPGDLDILVRFDDAPSDHASRYFELLAELEHIMGMPVDIIEEGSVRNPLLAAEFAASKVVLYEAA